MSLIEMANQHSERFEPAFAQLDIPAVEGEVNYAALGVSFRRKGRVATVLPRQGEELVTRHAVIASAVGLMNSQGQPPEIGGTNKYAPVQIAYGAGELLVTDRRLVLLLTRAESIVGDISITRGKVLVAVMTFDHVHSVAVERKNGFLGRVKYTRSLIQCLSHVAALTITDVLGLVGEGPQPAPTDNPLLTLNNLVVEAAARSRMHNVKSDQEREILQRALNGERSVDGNEIVAQLCP
ncbi:hypothetical protein [Streptomyces xylophagus]|uniref:hypothetical protein n=1 Tax=Streptomyces xylophagus TaxID=285514 RepID=UPI00131BDF2F|nr:hypothetical protein [Streptomyces xylophagus]